MARPIYTAFEVSDASYTVRGGENRTLHGIDGLTEAQADNCARHLIEAFKTGRREVQDAFKDLLGITQ